MVNLVINHKWSANANPKQPIKELNDKLQPQFFNYITTQTIQNKPKDVYE